MSVIMLDDEIYDKVAASLVHYLTAGEIWCYPYGKAAKDMTADEFEFFIRHEIAEWRNQNAISYDKAYPEDSDGGIDPMKFKEVWAAPPVQLYKWLEAIEYQIETEYESSLMQKAMTELAHNIISKTPEYEAAQWA